MENFGVDPSVSLAISLTTAPLTYALLLGSGVSRAAGIPTGWEVTLDLVRKAAVAGGDEAPEDPLSWYRERFGEDPNYSEVVDGLAPSRAERRNLLKGYFEPTEAERQDGEKVPTAAHEAIARLAAEGYLSVILTTNFDRLMETALESEGITPAVIDTPDSVSGAQPLQHARVTVVKVNGDYLDSRIKNTPEELEEYDPEIDLLLDKIFDEYGLIICGWSGNFDTALKDALQRSRSRRYTTYWVSRGELSEEAERLTRSLSGVVVRTEGGADQFFATLEEKVSALESLQEGDPLTPRMTVATVKRYLEEDRYRIRLRDFLVEEASTLKATLFSREKFPIDRSGTDEELPGQVQQRLKSYDVLCESALGVLTVGGYWARENQLEPFAELLRAAAQPPNTQGSYYLELYPALRLLYASGIVSIIAQNWAMLRVLARKIAVYGLAGFSGYDFRPAGYALHPASLSRDLAGDGRPSLIFPNQRYYLPVTEYLYQSLREPLREFYSHQAEYKNAFDSFEVMLSLVSMNLEPINETNGPSATSPSRIRLMYERNYSDEKTTYELIKTEFEEQGASWEPVASGLIQADTEAVAAYFQNMDTMIYRRPWG
jgi:hypothetical protein